MSNVPNFRLRVTIDIYVDEAEQVDILERALYTTAAAIAASTGAPVGFHADRAERGPVIEQVAPAGKGANASN
jgi:hypothetical protein